MLLFCEADLSWKKMKEEKIIKQVIQRENDFFS